MHRLVRSSSCLTLAAIACASVLAASGAANAQRDYERPRESDNESHFGPYLAGGLGGGVQWIDLGDGSGALQGEMRLGFSFGRLFQVYLDADFSGSSHPPLSGISGSPTSLTASDVMLGLRYLFYADRFIGVYGRAGLGLGIITGLVNYDPDNYDRNTEFGIAEVAALGMEFRLGGRDNKWAVSPEVFYRRTNESQYYRMDTLGLAVLINFN
jgi:hypothetical protein